MAWFGQIVSFSFDGPDRIVAQTNFYDDTRVDGGGVPVVQFSLPIVFPASADRPTVVAQIRLVGASCRATSQRVDNLNASGQVGQPVSIP